MAAQTLQRDLRTYFACTYLVWALKAVVFFTVVFLPFLLLIGLADLLFGGHPAVSLLVLAAFAVTLFFDFRRYLGVASRRRLIFLFERHVSKTEEALLTCYEWDGRPVSGIWSKVVERAASKTGTGALNRFAFLHLWRNRPAMAHAGLLVVLLGWVYLYPAIWHRSVVSLRAQVARVAGILKPEGAASGTRVARGDGDLVFKDIRYSATYPDYLGRSAESKASLSGAIIEPVGTAVDVEGVLGEDYKDVTARFANADGGREAIAISVKRSGDFKISFQMVLTSSGVYWIEATSRDGKRHIDAQNKPVTVILDEKPEIAWRFPKAETELTVGKDAVIAAQADARDDHGLAKIGYAVRASVGSREVTLESVAEKSVKNRSVSFELNLGRFVFKPGEKAEVVLFAIDNDGLQGGKRADSAPLVLHIRSVTDEMAELAAAGAEFEGALTNVLAGLLEADFFVTVERRVRQGLLDRLERDRVELVKTADRVSAILLRKPKDEKDQGIFLDREFVERVKAFGAAMKTNGLFREQADQAEALLLDLMDRLAHQLANDVATMRKEIGEIRRELADLLKEYQTRPSDEIKEKIQTLLAKLKLKMEALSKKVRELEAQRSDAFMNLDKQASGSESELMDRFDEIMRRLDEKRFADAAATLQESLSDLERLLNTLESQSAFELTQYEKTRYTALNELMEDLAYLKKAEGELIKQTEAVEAAMNEKQGSGDGRSRIEDELAGLIKKLGLEVAFLSAGSDPFSMIVRYVYGDLNQSADRLKALLVEKAFPEMLNEAVSIRERLGQLAKIGVRNPHVSEADRLVGELIEKLKRFMNSVSEPSSKDGRELSRLRRRQEKIRERTAEVQEKVAHMEELKKEEGLQNVVSSAALEMKRAAEKLQAMKPRPAVQKEKEAQEYLLQAERAIQKSLKQIKETLAAMRGQSYEKRERIEIPKDAVSERIKKIRSEIMKGMADEKPRGFEEMIKGYYERLLEK